MKDRFKHYEYLFTCDTFTAQGADPSRIRPKTLKRKPWVATETAIGVESATRLRTLHTVFQDGGFVEIVIDLLTRDVECDTEDDWLLDISDWVYDLFRRDVEVDDMIPIIFRALRRYK